MDTTQNTSIKGPGEVRTYDGSKLRIGIVHARWNRAIIDPLLAGVLSVLHASGVTDSQITIQTVPGSYELPLAVHGMYLASQREAAAATAAAAGGGRGGMGAFSSSAIGGGGGGSALDLLGASTTDLTALPAKADEDAERGQPAQVPEKVVPFDAIVAIGALIKGSTMHFEYISDAVSHGLMRVQIETGCPVVFGLLTLLTEEQGFERAGLVVHGKKGHNHGEDWGAAAVELALKRRGWEEGRFVD